MSPRKPPSDTAASVRVRLGNLARQRNTEFQVLLAEFGIERLLYRLSVSPYSDRFVLKGATLLKLWSHEHFRATWDLDLLDRSGTSVGEVVAVVRELCQMEADDGLIFDPDSLQGEEIRAGREGGGVRVRLEARLAEARIPLQLDIGFGDVVIPAPLVEEYPTLLGQASPRILVYPREAVVAEKLEAMVALGVTNSRMKDFYDVSQLATTSSFEGETLLAAVLATFSQRETPFPDGEPLVLSQGFLAAPERRAQWRAFLRRSRLAGELDTGELSQHLRRFLLPVLAAAHAGVSFTNHWSPGGPWIPRRGGDDRPARSPEPQGSPRFPR